MIQSTSLEAYENFKPKIPTDQEKILSVLEKEKGLTYNEIALRVYKKLLLNPDVSESKKAFSWRNSNKVSRRMKELIEQGKVMVKETKICSLAKSNCKSYVKL